MDDRVGSSLAGDGGLGSAGGVGSHCSQPAIRMVMMPRDQNPQGTVFGGLIMSLMDQAALVEAIGHGGHRFVTVAVDRLEFHEPLHVGDVVSLFTRTLRVGRTSIRIKVVVDALRVGTRETIRVTEGEVVLVAVTASGESTEIVAARPGAIRNRATD